MQTSRADESANFSIFKKEKKTSLIKIFITIFGIKIKQGQKKPSLGAIVIEIAL